MATKKLRSIKGRRVRLTRLDDCGNPVFGACSSIVTSGFITVTIAHEVEAGDEYTQKNAWGEFCVNEKDPDIIKYANTSIQLCEVDPDAMDIIGGATPVTAGEDTIGVTFGSSAPTGAFAVEVWTKKAGQDACAAGVQEWGYFVVPFLKNGKLDGDITIENAPLNITMTAEGYEVGAAWGKTPYNDNPMRATGGFPAGEIWGMVTTNVQPPPLTSGCVELADPANIVEGDSFPPNPLVSAETDAIGLTLVSLGYVVDTASAWTVGEFFSIGTFHFYWDGTVWKAGEAPA